MRSDLDFFINPVPNRKLMPDLLTSKDGRFSFFLQQYTGLETPLTISGIAYTQPKKVQHNVL